MSLKMNTQGQGRRPAAVALAVAVATVGILVPTQFASAAPDLIPVADQAGLGRQWRVPAVESQVGVGGPLSIDPATMIELPGIPAGHDGALVRITVLGTSENTEVLAAGTPALTVAAGTSASTAVLVPMAEGAIAVSASAVADVRIEVLATFDGDPAIPGSTIALTTPVARADTAGEELAGAAVGSDGVTVGLVGRGDVPAEGVRAVYVTATLDAPTAGDLVVGGQAMAVGAGVTSVTTVVTPDASGAMTVSYAATNNTAAQAGLRVDVRGWVPEAPQNAERANVTGGYVPGPAAEPVDLTIPRHESVPLTVPAPAAVDLALALISAEPTEEPTLLDLGQARPGRGTGVLVDPSVGAVPQLTVIDVVDHSAVARGRDSSVDAQITWVGSFLSSEASTTETAPLITITSPADGAIIDFTEGEGLVLRGTVAGPTAVEKVAVEADGALVGTARLVYRAEGVEWVYEGSAPPGNHALRIVATDRSGQTVADGLNLTVLEPLASATILDPDTVVLPTVTTAGQPLVVSVSDDSVVLRAEPTFVPGDIIVSDATEGAPQGFLRRVQAIDQVGDTWVVTTVPAALTEAIWQVDIDKEVELLDPGEPVVTENTTADPGVELVDDGLPAVTLLTGDDVDVAPYEHSPDEGSDADEALTESTPLAAEPTPAESAEPMGKRMAPAGRARIGLVDVDKVFDRSVELKAAVKWRGEDVTDLSKADASKQANSHEEIKVSGGIALSGSARVAVSLQIVLKIDVELDWFDTRPVVRDFRVEAKAIAKAEATLDANIEASWEGSYERKVATIDLPTLTVWAGPVPIVITSSFQAYVEGEFGLSAAGALHVGVGVQREQTYGFSYSTDGGLKDLTGTKTTYTTPTFGQSGNGITLSVNLDAAFGPRLEFDISIYDAAGPVFSVELKAGLEAGFSFDGTVTPPAISAGLEIYLGVTLSGRVQLKVPIIDKVLMSADLFKLNKKYTLAQWSWTPDDGVAPSGPKPTPSPTPTPTPSPTPDPGGQPVAFAQVSAGVHFSSAVTVSGDVYAWGTNAVGQLGLGLGTTDDQWSPAKVPGLSNVASVSSGNGYSLAVTTSGDVYAWGTNAHGQLGLGTTDDRWSPAKVQGLSNVASVSAGWDHSLAATVSGDLYAWGRNEYGQLGLGTTDDQWSPAKVQGLSNVASMSAGWGSYSLAVTASGDLYAWGHNSVGQSGLGTTDDQWSPAKVPGLSNVASVSAGEDHSLAVTASGDVYAWGWNEDGRLGLGTTDNHSSPAKVPDLSNVTSVSAGCDYSLVITASSDLHAWGRNVYGQLGLGTTDDQWSSAEVPGLSNVASVSAGWDHALAATASGDLYAWGYNGHGGLGLGTTDRQSSPVKVTPPTSNLRT